MNTDFLRRSFMLLLMPALTAVAAAYPSLSLAGHAGWAALAPEPVSAALTDLGMAAALQPRSHRTIRKQ